MAGIIFKLTDAGRQALINAKQDGTQTRTIVSIGVTATAFTPTATITAVPGEIKRLSTIAGDVVAKDTIHVTIRDEGTSTYTVRGLGVYLDNGVLLGTYSQAAVILEKSSASIFLLSTDLRVLDGSIDISTLQFGATNFINPPATTEQPGVVELATPQETALGADGVRAVTSAGLKPLLEGKQPLDATLTALAAVNIVADRLIYTTGVDQFSVTPLTAFIRTLLDDADAVAARSTLGAAPLASPGLTGTPTAPTAAVDTNTAQLATTAFVIGQAGAAAPKMDGAANVGTATRFAREDHVHPSDTSLAPIASPGLTGIPTAPTAVAGTNTVQIATTAFVIGQAGAEAPKMDGAATVGTATRYAREDHVHPSDTAKAPLASPALTGTPTAPTAADGTSTTQLATTAFVQNAVGGYLAKGVTGGTVTLTEAEASNPVIALTGTLTSALNLVVPVTVKRVWAIYNSTTGAFGVTVKTAAGTGVAVAQGKRNLVYTDGTNVYDGFNDFDSIAITGTSTAPTAAVGTSTTQLATTAFVIGQAGAAAPKMDGAANVGTATRFAREDHVHPSDTSLAPIASPGLTGIPTAPTAVAGTNTVQIATTAFVIGQAGAEAPKMDGAATVGTATRYAREDHVHPSDTAKAPLASPALTGTPTAPTAADGTSTTQLATTAFVQNAVGGYLAKGVTGGTVTLTEAEASNPVIALTGTLTSALNLVVPVTVKRVWAIYNSTTGAFGVTVKTAAGTGVAVAQGKRNLVYTDGTNVYDGFNDFDSIAITGTSTAPTAAVGTSTTQLATTAFVIGQAGAAAPKMDGAATVGTATRFAREDHVHPSDTSRAPLASPGLTGVPTAPTAATGTNSNQIATTAFVVARTQIATETVAGLSEVATQPETDAGDDDVRSVTPKKIAPAFGIGQALQDLSSSRVLGVVYTNTTRKPICVYANANSEIAGDAFVVIRMGANANAMGDVSVSRSPVSPGGIAVNAVIPAGFVYLVAATGTGGVSWRELR
ncbi:hypothetical protein DZC30_05000 [Comamonas testosteroni]|uniref:Tail fiber protein n=1 Tax=Comamonas testosteroni TaxID=285 RepID=A0A373FPQ8_COMTE|nr:hypothetical protein [Comamonas testosteroni]RGE46128.1 hypothetical protein DZC30_05000 [Comamonas testosteroni]